MLFPVALLGDVIDVAECLGPIRSQDLGHFGERPDVVFPFDALAVGILGRVERPLGAGHPAEDVIHRLPRHPGEVGVAGGLVGLEIGRGQAGRCRRAFSRSAGPASGRRSSSGRSRRPGGRKCRRGPSCRACAGRRAAPGCRRFARDGASSTLRSIGCGNLGAWPKPPWSGSKPRIVVRAAWSSSLASSEPEPSGSVPNARNCSRHLGRRLDDLVSPFLPGLVHAREDAGKAGHPPRVGRREIGAAEERLELGREEHRHRPAAVPGHRHHGRHVDLVEVGPLFAVDLDVDEVLVHERGDVRVLEALALHDMAPVAGRVADRQEDRLVLGLRPGECLASPGIPVDRVGRVLEQVRAGLTGQAVGLVSGGRGT